MPALRGVLDGEGRDVAIRIEIENRVLVEIARLADWDVTKNDTRKCHLNAD